MRRSRRGAGKIVALLFILFAAGAALLFVGYRAASTKVKRDSVKEAVVEAETKAAMTEEQRLAYLQEFVVVSDVQIVPDTKPDSDEPVPGLLRVKGIVVNKGDQKLDVINLVIHPENKEGEVISSHIQNIAGPTGLAPGATRDFQFQIPEKKEFGGNFRQSLR